MKKTGLAGGLAGLVAASAVTVAVLLLFIGKPFNMDDPLFIWAARHISVNPLDFFGFTVNWYGTEMPMHEVTKNPPLASYYMAAAASVLGWGEMALHAAFIVPAVGVASGTYMLARRYTGEPLLAALATASAPVFLVSATTVMSDVMMTALWVWAVALWLRGTDREDQVTLLLAAVLAALAALTKYFAVSLIPLFIAYSIFRGSRLTLWLPAVALVAAVLGGYQVLTSAMYGKGLLLDAVGYAVETRAGTGTATATKGLAGLVFTGGCVMTALLHAPGLWKKGALAVLAGASAVLAIVAYSVPLLGFSPPGDALTAAHFLFFFASGVFLGALTVAELARSRDAETLILVLWVWGTFFFAAFVNWTLNGRSVLPMAPAVAILVARRLETRGVGPALRYAPLVPAFIISIAAAQADTGLALSAKAAAREITSGYGGKGTVWYQGHWGFQHYMDEYGAEAVDFNKSVLEPGDIVAVPTNNTNLRPMDRGAVARIDRKVYPASRLGATMAKDLATGFYMGGPGVALPWRLGTAHEEAYLAATLSGYIIYRR